MTGQCAEMFRSAVLLAPASVTFSHQPVHRQIPARSLPPGPPETGIFIASYSGFTLTLSRNGIDDLSDSYTSNLRPSDMGVILRQPFILGPHTRTHIRA